MDLSLFQSQTAQRLRAEGRAQARRESVLLLLEHRGVHVSEEERERINGCRDLGTLGVWFTRAVTATSAADVLVAEGPWDGSCARGSGS
ncbi:hypothetical protein [Streptomyces sp. Tu 3180]|uniref:hypothetical protein n=1 Tax=Streptomyces sp. Tu 3180 TaxID=2682611 RepID=UPI0013589D87|nr:hypothetical protein [Streptomyces sp. Tu 3180]KAF3466967.1 hypothetical protein GL259_23425 [Streptomyces sp. Tu 3180]